MRAGNLDTPANLLKLDADLVACKLDWIWCGIQTKEEAEPPFPSGLRSPSKIAIRAWWDARIQQGRYLLADGRLFHIDSARDFTGRRAELAITATELIGEPGEYRPDGAAPRACRVFMNYDAQSSDDLGQATTYRIRAEVALIETGRVQVDEHLVVAGVDYVVTDYASGTDDGIVRGVWLERMQ
ncbi:hypothetical protein NK553_18395 [Pseudomonas sp. ZM23]|uniref:HNH nuclease domain-containing protein n=1 Tax=Pseudomonas triclosanedens TaxID=2961893 RepID=A0ABY6ZRI8_9PSED|nr:hypothetical protein [Pseudomonas triclosanedens]MCP8465925.1 hypothetical protein [Pseudomonas triclosanedens]MCP8472246.1 hypothetical protein [Pseudomonas triclosanedens]MCP8477224.1 hypothetical protein [Pseudomonas triclosanedens]WAI47438.1 hypothetical protein OU419_16820 [Pseudomonas triclosanedens]